MSELPNKNKGMLRHSVYGIDHLSWIGTSKKIYCEGESINWNSTRLKIFKKSHKCVTCDLVGQYFAIEKNGGNNGKYHVNMYGLKDGQEILFTRDHTIPKKYGGPDTMENQQTMCLPCNTKKDRMDIKSRRK